LITLFLMFTRCCLVQPCALPRNQMVMLNSQSCDVFCWRAAPWLVLTSSRYL